MLKKREPKKSILPKYLFTYIVMLVMPVCIISIVVYQFNLKMYHEKIVDNADMNLQSLRQTLDVETDELIFLATQIFSNKNLRKIDDDNMLDTMISFKEELMNYASVNHYVKDIGLYFPSHDFVFSSSGASDFDKYASVLYDFAGMGPAEFKQFLKTCLGVTHIPAKERGYNDEDHYACIIKETNLTSIEDRVLFVLIDVNYIKELIENFEYDIYIFDGDSNLIVKNNSKYGSDISVAQEYIRNEDDGKDDKDSGKNIYIRSLDSDVNSWQYVMIAKYGDVFADLFYIQVVYIILLIVIIAVGIYIIYYSIRSFYSPINKLKTQLEGDMHKDDGEYNEIETVRIRVDRILEANAKLESEVDKSYSIARDFMIYKLINASMGNERLKEKFRFYGVNFDHKYYYIAVFHIENLEPEASEDVLGALNGFVEKYDCVTTNVFEHNKLCLILPSAEKEHDEKNRRLLLDLQQFLEQLTISSVTVGVGNTVDDISVLWKSYIEAQNAYSYFMVKGKSRIIFFDETKSERKTNFAIKHRERLETYIKAGERQKALHFVDEIIDELIEGSASIQEVKYICFDLAFMVITIASDMTSESDNYDYKHFDLAQIVEFESLSSFSNHLKQFMNSFFDFVVNQDEESDDLIDQILQYIHENYNKPYFTVDNIADKFGFSNTYLSQYFKSKKMLTVSNYIAKVQIDETKKLLIETDKNIKEIAEEIGYTDVSNFIRRFKAKTGVTPGLYRKASRKMLNEEE